ncbi:MAG: serine/threonine-protein phosphatase [Anaerolineae bacterium]|nr:serine/threonine-protein phosphatase [Anaerolineae bacterium]
MPIVSAYKSDTGRRRRRNEDFVWVNESTSLFIVADGMGGHEAGEVASQMAATTVGELITSELKVKTEPILPAIVTQMIIEAVEEANKTVYHAAKEAGQKRHMGTTIVVALVRSSVAYISHVGDARAYLVRGSTLMQLTQDDSWKVQFGTQESRSKFDIPEGKFEHILTKAIGQDATLNPSFTEVKLTPGDWLLLCSDGLWNMVEDNQILTELQKADDNPTQAVDALIAAANEGGGKDNISVAAIKILPSENV